MFNWFLITVTVLIGTNNAASKSYHNYTVYLVRAQNEKDLNLLHDMELNFIGIDFWDRIHRVANSSYRVMVEPQVNKKFINVLNKNKIKNHLIIDNVQNEVKVQGRLRFKKCGRTFGFEQFWNYKMVNAYLIHLAKKYVEYTKVSVIGKSGQKRSIRSIHITGNHGDGEPRTILVDATIHAREWISPMMAVYLIHQLVENRQDNLKLLSNIDWVIVPIVNPDGYVYSHEIDRFWRKTRTQNNDKNCPGVDPNRNFDFHWDTPAASSTSECSEAYRGPKPHSIPEVKHLADLLREYSNASLYLTLHAYGGYLLFPYGFDRVSVENEAEHRKLAKSIRDEIVSNGGTDYQVGNSAKLLYPASGGSDDYAVGVAKIPLAFTMELPAGGRSGFDIPESEIKAVVQETFEGLKVIGDYFASKNKKRKKFK